MTLEAQWLLEEGIFDEKTMDRMIDEIIEHDLGLTLVLHYDLNDNLDDYYNQDECVIFYGSLRFASKIRREASWVPGIYCNIGEFDCTYYYPIFGENILNSDYVVMPVGDLKRQKDFIFKIFGNVDSLFVRPDSGSKSFTGEVISIDNWEYDLDLLLPYTDDIELCVIASPKEIESEWRLVIAEETVIAGSGYQPTEISDVPDDIVDFGNSMAKVGYEPDPAWVMDICRLKNGELRIVEVNSFSCSGLYACEMEPIVKKVSELAVRDWKEIYEI